MIYNSKICLQQDSARQIRPGVCFTWINPTESRVRANALQCSRFVCGEFHEKGKKRQALGAGRVLASSTFVRGRFRPDISAAPKKNGDRFASTGVPIRDRCPEGAGRDNPKPKAAKVGRGTRVICGAPQEIFFGSLVSSNFGAVGRAGGNVVVSAAPGDADFRASCGECPFGPGASAI